MLNKAEANSPQALDTDSWVLRLVGIHKIWKKWFWARMWLLSDPTECHSAQCWKHHRTRRVWTCKTYFMVGQKERNVYITLHLWMQSYFPDRPGEVQNCIKIWNVMRFIFNRRKNSWLRMWRTWKSQWSPLLPLHTLAPLLVVGLHAAQCRGEQSLLSLLIIASAKFI